MADAQRGRGKKGNDIDCEEEFIKKRLKEVKKQNLQKE